MINNSRAEYIFIRLCIFGLHFVAPLSILYCVFVFLVYGRRAATYRFPLLVECVAVAETLFYLVVYLPYRYRLQHEAQHPPAPSREERRELFALCNENIGYPETYLRMWFHGAELQDIKRENVKDFLLWAFFNCKELKEEYAEELEEYVDATEKLLGSPIAQGRGKAKALLLTLDRVDMLHRSLVWYCCVGFVDFLTFIKLLLHGFTFYRTALSRFFTLFPLRPYAFLSTHRSPAKHTTYWYRPHTSKTRLPIVFIHGIGIGLYPYTNFLSELNKGESADPDDQIGVLAIEIMPISFRITHAALSRTALCEEITSIITTSFGPTSRFVLISHSYGTVISTHLLSHAPLAPLIGPIFLIDPVSILLHLPDVAYNFTRRKPRHANEFQLYYFASMDMGVAHTLARHFFWSENVLWKKDLRGRKVTVSLGERDLIVNTQAVGTYLSRPVAGIEESIMERDAEGILPAESNGTAESTSLNPSTSPPTQESTKPTLRARGGGGKASSPLSSSSSSSSFSPPSHTTNNTPANTTLTTTTITENWKTTLWTGQGLEVLWFPGLDHAQAFDKPATRGRLVECARRYCVEG